jgi:hypothetical protein
MTIEDKTEGWSGVPAAKEWLCPECETKSDVELWSEIWIECETCGEHEGRECPNCGHWFDHVWNDDLVEANKQCM